MQIMGRGEVLDTERGGTEIPVELAPIDDDDPLSAGGEGEHPAHRRVDQAGGRAIEDEALRDLEEVAQLIRNDPGAVRRDPSVSCSSRRTTSKASSARSKAA